MRIFTLRLWLTNREITNRFMEMNSMLRKVSSKEDLEQCKILLDEIPTDMNNLVDEMKQMGIFDFSEHPNEDVKKFLIESDGLFVVSEKHSMAISYYNYLAEKYLTQIAWRFKLD